MTHTPESSFLKTAALVLSYIIHPIFIPTYIFSAFLYFGNIIYDPYSELAQTYVVLLIFITTAIIPLVMLVINLLLLRKKISNAALLMNSRKDRIVPFFYIGIFYMVLTYMFKHYLNFPILLTSLMMIITACVLVTAIISISWKISAHAISLGASLMIFILTNTIIPNEQHFFVIIGTLIISGFVLSSRMLLNAHTPAQVYTGFLLGMILSGIGLYFLLPNLFSFTLIF